MYIYMLHPIYEIAHFMKWAILLPSSRNGQKACPLHETGKLIHAHFMKWAAMMNEKISVIQF